MDYAAAAAALESNPFKIYINEWQLTLGNIWNSFELSSDAKDG